jgi:hypothetical protein
MRRLPTKESRIMTAEPQNMVSQDFYKEWKVKRWTNPPLKREEHLLEGEWFEIAEVGGKPFLRLLGALESRWGFQEKELQPHGNGLFVYVMLAHGSSGNKTKHLVGFTHELKNGNPDPHKLLIRMPHDSEGLNFQDVLIHGGTAHAED